MRILFITLLMSALGGTNGFSQDSLIIEIDEKTEILIHTKDRKALKDLRKLDINQIIHDAVSLQLGEEDEEIIYEYELMEKDQHKIVLEKKSMSFVEKLHKSISKVDTSDTERKAVKGILVLDLGISNYLENGSFPDENGAPYGVKILNSTYFSLGYNFRKALTHAKNPLYIETGLALDWHNFKFYNDNYLYKGDDGIIFSNYESDFDVDVKKTKLVVSYLNIPLRFTYHAINKKGKPTFKLGIGAYGGLRVGSYTKVKQTDGKKHKDKSNFYLSNWRYGLEGMIGYKGLELFAKYDLNPLFVDGKGPDLNTVSFGIRF